MNDVLRVSLLCGFLFTFWGCNGSDGDSDDGPHPPPPASPSGLTANAITTERVDLAWTDNATEYRVEQSTDGTVWAPIAALPADSQAHVVRGLTPASPYFFRVASAHSVPSPYAGPATVTTAARAWTGPITPATRPSARFEHSAIYDAANRRMVVFGGLDGTPFQNDVWQLDLATVGSETWTQLAPSGTPPSGRWLHSAVYDNANQRMIVFGGNDGAESNQVWALTLPAPPSQPAWSQLSPTGTPPLARDNHAALYDSMNSRMIVFGGFAGSNALSDVWSLTLPPAGTPAWIQLSPTLTPPATLTPGRYGHSAAYDGPNQRMLLFGGNSGTIQVNEAWTLTLPGSGNPAWTFLSPTVSPPQVLPPDARVDHATILDEANGRLTLFGGDAWGTPASDAWVLNPGGSMSWQLLTPQGGPPPGRLGHSAVFDSANRRMVVFGGDDGSFTFMDDVWILRL